MSLCCVCVCVSALCVCVSPLTPLNLPLVSLSPLAFRGRVGWGYWKAAFSTFFFRGVNASLFNSKTKYCTFFNVNITTHQLQSTARMRFHHKTLIVKVATGSGLMFPVAMTRSGHGVGISRHLSSSVYRSRFGWTGFHWNTGGEPEHYRGMLFFSNSNKRHKVAVLPT